MEKYQHMKSFITNSVEYSKYHSEKSCNSLQRDLQILGVTTDVTIFSPTSNVSTEFYTSLYELLAGLESRSCLIWSGLNVLHNACRNQTARYALIHTFKFTSVFTKLLGAHLTQEKKRLVLHLMHQLTFGVKISWQETHLPHLMRTLTEWIVGEDQDIIELSLGILVNLCHKNLPAVYTLLRAVDHKELLRIILKMQQTSVSTRVQAWKLLIILQDICKDIPDKAIKEVIEDSFNSMIGAFIKRDVFLMKHIVEFFKDLGDIEHVREILLSYERFQVNTEKLLDLISDRCDAECVGPVLQFIQMLLNLNIDISDLYIRIVTTAQQWIGTELTCSDSLALIHSIACKSRTDSKVSVGVMEQLESGFDLLLPLLDIGGDGITVLDCATRSRLSELFQVLQLMCKTTLFRNKLLTVVKPLALHKVFTPLTSLESKGHNFFEAEVTDHYVHTLSFISSIAPHDTPWLEFYKELLQHKQVQMILATSLYTGNQHIKKEVLMLAGTTCFPADSLSTLARSMCELEPMVLLPSESFKKSASLGSTNEQFKNMTPLFASTKEHCLDQFIEQMGQALKQKDISDISTSAVMELYEYKMAALQHSEKALCDNLEAATNHSAHLQHQLAQIRVETFRLRQLLFHNQQCLEGLQKEKRIVESKFEKTKFDLDSNQLKHLMALKHEQKIIIEKDITIAEHLKTLGMKVDELDNARKQLETLNQHLEKKAEEVVSLNRELDQQVARTEDLKNKAGILEARVAKREKIIKEKDIQLEDMRKNLNDLRKELSTSEILCNAHVKNIKEKDEELEATHKQLAELQRVRDTIFEISNPGKCRKLEK